MHLRNLLLVVALLAGPLLRADPALTIYNQKFAVVRDTVPLDLKPGVNTVSFANTTAHLEPDSVILRDPAGKTSFRILEQNYRNDPVSQELLLSLFEGKTIDFLIKETNKPDVVVQGKVIRSGYAPHSQDAQQRYGEGYAPDQPNANQPVIEREDGKIVFGLPGQPLFPSLGDDTILKPALNWKIESDNPQKLDAELAYVTGGMSWWADYNLAAPENGDVIDLVGWITMDNQSGKTFENARIKLMAGDVNKIQPENGIRRRVFAMAAAAPGNGPPVTEKTFDEYHLYTVQRPVTLHDRETKQVEFIHASNVTAAKVYIYDGARFNGGVWSNDMMASGAPVEDSEFGTESNTKVSVMREIKNSAENGLGVPLPAGRIRFYKQGDDRQLEFTGENTIDHTPKDETLHIYTGDSFDLVGERKRTSFHMDAANHVADESFEIKLRNHKTTPVEIRVVEHLYRWTNWQITAKSDNFSKTSAQEIKFQIPVKPDEEKILTYTAHYSW